MKHKTIRRPYYGDIAKHPEAKQIPFYLNRCHTTRPVCPFCATIDCEDHEYRVELTGYGYNTYTPACEGEHNFVFTVSRKSPCPSPEHPLVYVEGFGNHHFYVEWIEEVLPAELPRYGFGCDTGGCYYFDAEGKKNYHATREPEEA